MNTSTRTIRTTSALGLVLAAIMSVAWTVLAPPFPDGYAARLVAIDEGGTSALVSAALFAASQLPMLVAVLAIGRLAASRAPRLARAGVVLAVLGAFGHAVFGGVSLATVVMARDAANRDVHAAVLEAVEGEPAIMLFAAAGLLGTVLGLLVLAIALWRSRAVARWIPALLGVFLVVEFVGSNLSDFAPYASGVCLLVAFGALAVAVQRADEPGHPVDRAEPSPSVTTGVPR